MSTTTFASISTADLVTATGGAGQTFQDYTNAQRQKVADPYRQVVCTTAAVKGGPDLAKGMYGANATDADRIRGAELVNKFCLGGSQLPAQAPKSPF